MHITPNLEMNFPKEMPFLDRVSAAADLGFKGGDIFHTANKDIPALAALCRQRDFTIGMVVGSKLQQGLNDYANHDEIVESVTLAAQHAEELGALHVTVLSGNTLKNTTASAQNKAIIDGLRRLIPIAEKRKVNIVLEVLNSLYDHPGYYLDDSEVMTGIIRAVNHPLVKGLYDIYHVGIMRGNLVEDIRSSIDAIGHFHAAGIPGRNEPDTGEQNYPMICGEIAKLGYKGHISMEYSPTPGRDPLQALARNKAWLEGACC